MSAALLAAAMALAQPTPGAGPPPGVEAPVSGEVLLPPAAGAAAAPGRAFLEVGWIWTRLSLWQVRAEVAGVDGALSFTRPLARPGEWLERGFRAGGTLAIQSGRTAHGNGLPVLTVAAGGQGGLYLGPLEVGVAAALVHVRVARVTPSGETNLLFLGDRSMNGLGLDLSARARLTLAASPRFALFAEVASPGLFLGFYRPRGHFLAGGRFTLGAP